MRLFLGAIQALRTGTGCLPKKKGTGPVPPFSPGEKEDETSIGRKKNKRPAPAN